MSTCILITAHAALDVILFVLCYSNRTNVNKAFETLNQKWDHSESLFLYVFILLKIRETLTFKAASNFANWWLILKVVLPVL